MQGNIFFRRVGSARPVMFWWLPASLPPLPKSSRERRPKWHRPRAGVPEVLKRYVSLRGAVEINVLEIANSCFPSWGRNSYKHYKHDVTYPIPGAWNCTPKRPKASGPICSVSQQHGEVPLHCAIVRYQILRWRRKFQQSTYTARVTMLTYLCSRNTLCVWYHKTQYQESTQFVSGYINFLPIIVCHAMPQTWCFLLILQCYAEFGWSTLKQLGTVKKMNENNRALLYMGMAHDT